MQSRRQPEQSCRRLLSSWQAMDLAWCYESDVKGRGKSEADVGAKKVYVPYWSTTTNYRLCYAHLLSSVLLKKLREQTKLVSLYK